MKIAYITDQILPRTATDTKQMVSMVSAMSNAGANVTLVTPRRWFSPKPDPDRIAAFYEVEPNFSMQTVRSVFPSIRGVEKVAQGVVGPLTDAAVEADVIYTRTLPILIGALAAGRRPVVYETYRPWPEQRPSASRFFRWLGRQRLFLGAVLHSNLARDSYARAGIPSERLITAYNGYDSSHLLPVLSQREARAACGLPLDRKIVVYSGHVSKRKGVDLLLTMAESMPGVTFVLVGSEGQGAIETRAALLPNVIVERWMPESRTAAYLYSADVLVIPPTARPLRQVGNTVLPLKTFHYMASGRPILAPDTPDVAEMLVNDQNACLVAPDQPETAADRLRDLLGDEDLMRRLGRSAARTASGLTWERRGEVILQFLRDRLEVVAG